MRALVPGGIDARVRKGFPGWHLECSAMSRTLLGDVIDIHTGGEDNVFPHHECEIAQSHGAFGTVVDRAGRAPEKNFARYWVHGRHLLVDGRKMSKRDGTFFAARDLLDPAITGRSDVARALAELGFPGGRVSPVVLRLALVATPYSQPMNFTFDSLVQARAIVERLQSCHDRWSAAQEQESSPEVLAAVERSGAAHLREFDDALDEDLNTSQALRSVFAFTTEINQLAPTGQAARRAIELLRDFDDVLDVLAREARAGLVRAPELERLAAEIGALSFAPSQGAADALRDSDIERAIAIRHAHKRAKSFAVADAIRDRLREMGVIIEDTRAGVRWRVSDASSPSSTF